MATTDNALIPTVVDRDDIIYPDSDGQPMADNTKQFRWITTLKINLDWIFAENPQVFVAGDHLWYPIQGNNKLRMAPDVNFNPSPTCKTGSAHDWELNLILLPAPNCKFLIPMGNPWQPLKMFPTVFSKNSKNFRQKIKSCKMPSIATKKWPLNCLL